MEVSHQTVSSRNHTEKNLGSEAGRWDADRRIYRTMEGVVLSLHSFVSLFVKPENGSYNIHMNSPSIKSDL